MCLKKGSCSSTLATRPFMGAGTCVSGSPHSGKESQLPILPPRHTLVKCTRCNMCVPLLTWPFMSK